MLLGAYQKMHNFELKSPENEEDWVNYHKIRRVVLFEERGRFGVYDENHPDEYLKDNYPKILVKDGAYLGVARIDIENDKAVVRRVAIDSNEQRKGYGRALLELIEEFARKFPSVKMIESSVADDAVEFYRKCNYKTVKKMKDSESTLMTKELKFDECA